MRPLVDDVSLVDAEDKLASMGSPTHVQATVNRFFPAIKWQETQTDHQTSLFGEIRGADIGIDFNFRVADEHNEACDQVKWISSCFYYNDTMLAQVEAFVNALDAKVLDMQTMKFLCEGKWVKVLDRPVI